jgi:hypothetical protein
MIFQQVTKIEWFCKQLCYNIILNYAGNFEFLISGTNFIFQAEPEYLAMSRPPILKNFVREVDLFLQRFDKEHPELSKAQQKEVAKYRRISRLRDTSDRPVTEDANKLWEGF